MSTFYLIRHGQASFGAEQYDQLSELGMRQCALLGEWWRNCGLPVHRIVVGQMQRHRQSAEAFWQGYGGPPELSSGHWQVDTGLNEFDHEQVLHAAFPELAEPNALSRIVAATDNPRATFQRLFEQALSRWMHGQHDVDYAESWPAFKARITALLDRFATEPANSHAVLFTSGGPISGICQQLMAMPDSHVMNLLAIIMNSSISKVVNRNNRLQLISINGVPHLESKADRSLISYR